MLGEHEKCVNQFSRLLSFAILLPVGFFFLSFGISSTVPAPPDALVLVDSATGSYIAPPCLAKPNVALVTVPLRTARNLKYHVEDSCRNTGAFEQEGRSPGGMLLERLGILGSLPKRWNPDGTWNW